MLIAIIYLIIATPVYESDSLLRIKQPKGLGDSLLDAVPGASTAMMQNCNLLLLYIQM